MRFRINMTADETPVCGYKMPFVHVNVTLVFLIGVLFFSICTYGLAQELNIDTEEAVSHPKIEGFRSARFGMSESETLAAIQRDIELQDAIVESQTNDEDRTSSLVVTVEDIFPGSTPAQVAYIHGYRQRKLIQVNVLWGLPVSGEANPQTLVTTANLLRNYFLQQGFDPENSVLNARVDDRVLIVFRTTDEQGRMVLLQLISKELLAAEGEPKEELEPRFRVDSLLLSYIENINAPDIFLIKGGDF